MADISMLTEKPHPIGMGPVSADRPFANGKQFRRVPAEELRLPRSTHLRRMRKTLGKNGEGNDGIKEESGLTDSDFELYKLALMDGLRLDTESATEVTTKLKDRYSSSQPQEKTLIEETVGTMFSALYPPRVVENSEA